MIRVWGRMASKPAQERTEMPPETRRRLHGWGVDAAAATPAERETTMSLLRSRFGAGLWPTPPPRPQPLETAPRLTVPDTLAAIVDVSSHDRALHATGRSFSDIVALREGPFPSLPDAVAHPRTRQDVADVLDWCTAAGAACIPFGGGTSVVGGVRAAAITDRPVVTLQLRDLDVVEEVDPVSRAACVQAGATGPRLEAQLRRHDLTMRFFPQSFEMSTLGGWIATRAAGHYATGPTHIDDLVEQVEALTPRGWWSSRRLPASGAGPSPDRMLLGSEGILGVITRAWVRLQDRPHSRGGASAAFASFDAACLALRRLLQSGLRPANCRVLDATEAALSGAGDGTSAVMVIGVEAPELDVTHDLDAALTLVADHGGVATDRWSHHGGGRDSSWGESRRPADGSAEAWKRSFLRAPYLRDVMVDAGMIVETFETAVTYDRLGTLVERARRATEQAVADICGDGIVTCRVTHAYPDGAAPYLTVMAPGRPGGRVAQWGEIKAAASAAILAAGGSITHHHAVGRDHRRWYDQQRPDVFAAALAAAKDAVDPAGVLNPGVLL